MSKTPSIVLAGGGTAGHINPMLAIARAIREIEPDAKITMLGTQDKMEAQLVPAAGFDIEFIPRAAFPRALNKDTVRFPGKLWGGIRKAREVMKRVDADVVVGVGGYVCPPAYLSAAASRIPIIIHEANAEPGMANKLGGYFAEFVGVAFPNTPFRGAELVGMPMNEKIAHLDRARHRAQARRNLGLDENLPTLIVTGGSLGAKTLNEAVEANIDALPQWGFQVLHITGKDKTILDESGNPRTAQNYRQIEFCNSMQDVYAAADLLIVRSGAATVSEVAAVGVPAIFVPLPHGNGEQELNIRPLLEENAARMVEDHEATAQWFAREIPALMADSVQLERMGQKAYKLGIRDAAHVMAERTLKAVK